MTNTKAAIIAVCLLLASCGGLTTAEPEQPAEAAEVVEAPAPEPTNYLAQGKAEGYSAAVAAQTATGNDWNDVGLGWDAAMRSLGNVPADSPDYAEAQTKIQEYIANREVASVRYNDHLAELKARQAPTTTPTPTPEPTAWQLSPGWTQMRSEEGKALAYIPRDPIACRDGGDYCFEFDVMAQEGCPNGLYVEFQLIDPNTKAVIGMGNDLLPVLLPGQVGLLSINTRGPANIGEDTVRCY
ncbi:hypothetical protein [Nodosilinea sp. FACHB-13]|uniref:hypothetical protein n=1 Tax=Cyanophyceae TaxID=3028117 RepID=UPI001689D652|nr:hypothetical protein [Nodosilinea sp. FACHB-13]MBD2106721.1 hypothetical protein [Nodosilinea sp. FACHB-13]